MTQMQVGKDWRKRAAVLALIWILLLAVSLYFLGLLHTTFESNPQGQGILSRSWAGYIVESDLEEPDRAVEKDFLGSLSNLVPNNSKYAHSSDSSHSSSHVKSSLLGPSEAILEPILAII